MAKKKVRYTVSDGKLVLVLEPAEEGGYIVTAPLNPDVLTQAETVEEAFENARDVIALFEEDRAAALKAKPRRKRQKAK
jgi:predicted RNase H-like HicB family nuclease